MVVGRIEGQWSDFKKKMESIGIREGTVEYVCMGRYRIK